MINKKLYNREFEEMEAVIVKENKVTVDLFVTDTKTGETGTFRFTKEELDYYWSEQKPETYPEVYND